MKNIIDIEPLTLLDDDLYECNINLYAWEGFQSRQGPYGSIDKNKISNGKFKVFINVDQVKKEYTQSQYIAVRYLLDNQKLILDTLLNSLLVSYNEQKHLYDNTPNITNMDDFKDHIGLSTIHIMKSDKEGLAYIGFEIGCTWDDEHGIGVMTHKNKVVSIGEADVAFSSWITQIDNGTSVKNN